MIYFRQNLLQMYFPQKFLERLFPAKFTLATHSSCLLIHLLPHRSQHCTHVDLYAASRTILANCPPFPFATATTHRTVCKISLR